MAVGMQDPVLGPPVMAALRADIKACPAPREVKEGGHFLQEDVERCIRPLQHRDESAAGRKRLDPGVQMSSDTAVLSRRWWSFGVGVVSGH